MFSYSSFPVHSIAFHAGNSYSWICLTQGSRRPFQKWDLMKKRTVHIRITNTLRALRSPLLQLGWLPVAAAQPPSPVRLSATLWTAACPAPVSVLCCLLEFAQTHDPCVGGAVQASHSLLPFLLLSSIFPSIGVVSKESALCVRWPEYWSFSFTSSPSNNIQYWFPLGLTH